MKRKMFSAITLTLLLTSMLTLAFNIQTAKAEPEPQIIIGTTDSVEGTLDPAQAYDYFGWCILQQIAGTLVSVKPGSTTGAEFVPELAESWNVSDDSTIWDFTLRQGITFPDGTEFNATHVKYSFDRAITLIPSIPEGAPAGLGYDLIINRIEVLSTYKVRFYLNFPFSPFLGILACRASAIVDPNYAPIAQVNYTAGDPRASTPVAFIGPYNLSKWERTAGRDIEIKLDANPHYWNATSGYPKIKHIIFRFYSDSSSLRSAIDTGDVDMAFRHISPTDVLDLEDDPSVKVWCGPGAFIQYLCFQEKRAPFNDTRVRVAVAAALNRSTVCQTVFLDLASPLYSIIPPGMLGHTEAFKELGDANYTLTRSLLAELGYNEANKLKFDLWYESSGHYPMSAEQALLYKEAIEGSGVVEVTLKSADWSSYRQNRNDEIMDAYVYGWYPDYMDPDDYAFLYWASWLHINYSNATQLALYNEARATTNLTRRTELYAQIDNIAVEQCSVVPLYVDMSWAVTKPNIHGVYLDITQDMRYWLLYIAEAEPRTWTVDDDGPADFHTIQEAINAANLGDTIYVHNGTYYESLIISKPLRLIGESKNNTVVDGSPITPELDYILFFVVDTENVYISGFTIRNGPIGIDLYFNTRGCRNCIITDNIIASNYVSGISLSSSYNNTVVENTLINNEDGVALAFSSNNTVSGNNITNNYGGVRLFMSSGDTVSGNKIANNWCGIFPDESSSNTFSGNNVTNNGYGIYLCSSSNNVISGNIITNNTYQGIELYANSLNNSIVGNTVMNNQYGIWLHHYSDYNNIAKNTVTNNTVGIRLSESVNHNRISGNDILANNFGIEFWAFADDNLVYHNNFIGNTQQVEYACRNVWDYDYPSGGNYWSDYAGVDLYHGPDQDIPSSDGIGDIPYIIDANNGDRYPLMAPFNTFDAGTWNGVGYNIDVVSNSTVSDFFFDPNEGPFIHFNVTGPEGTASFCRVTIPKSLLWVEDGWIVLVDGQPIGYTQVEDENSTYLYFSYSHSTHEVQITGTHVISPPQTYALTITATIGGTTDPALGTYSYIANSSVQVTAIPDASYSFDYWKLDSVNMGSANPYTAVMDKDHTLKAFFSPIPPPLCASISPLSASINVGQSVTFTSTVTGGYTPYAYQWYLNGAPVPGATSASWTFTPTSSGIYYVHIKVTDTKANTAQSETARITVTAVPVGGYSIPIQVPTKTEPVLPYIALIATLTAIFTKLRPKTKRKR